MSDKKFVASYSSGKDCTLSIYKAIQSGMQPVGLIITYRSDEDKAWFHDLSEPVIRRLSDAFEIPIELVRTTGAEYEKNFDAKLKEYKEKGAEVCVFGDIDLEGHLEWGKARCKNAGLTPLYPLWHVNRKDAVLEFLDNGFTAHIIAINTDKLDLSYLGQPLSRELIAKMEQEKDVDVCGENGEYHTLVTSGPLFKHEFQFSFGEPIIKNGYAKLPVL